ncbi:unnamed protein product [Nippostrongylus brasiliensis]|uniref:Thyrotroph embryonic factor n=1 Tax=Nippostrongylus brasiliensis TaxID=27835 RepID=A0A0N4YSR7_NIPBR|nr:unnamed protein product [Nippostrongylus brasiliensis]
MDLYEQLGNPQDVVEPPPPSPPKGEKGSKDKENKGDKPMMPPKASPKVAPKKDFAHPLRYLLTRFSDFILM